LVAIIGVAHRRDRGLLTPSSGTINGTSIIAAPLDFGS